MYTINGNEDDSELDKLVIAIINLGLLPRLMDAMFRNDNTFTEIVEALNRIYPDIFVENKKT